jgi:carboxyl-terminal processing protease
MTNFYKTVISFLVGLFIFGLGIGVGYGLTTYVRQESQPIKTASHDFGLFWEVWTIVEDKFYNGIPDDVHTTYGAIRGALAALEDPYTIFVEPQPRALEKAELDGQFGGIGAYVYRDEENRVLLDPMIDSPAEKAGLLKDDILIKVDQTLIQPEMSTDEVVLLIRGKVGTRVSLVVIRQEEADPIALVIERAVIETPSVAWQLTEEDSSIGYIRVHLFSNRTNRELIKAFAELDEAGATHYILDLRGNGGGLLEAAVDVASIFLTDGIVLTEDRRGEKPKVYKIRQGEKISAVPLVVLIDGGTASASEIVAGALQDYERAILIGERTYGKGSVQLVYDLSDQSSLHVTVAKWFTPNNHSIDEVGLTPDIEVLFTEEDHATGRDPQYLRAVEYLQTRN